MLVTSNTCHDILFPVNKDMIYSVLHIVFQKIQNAQLAYYQTIEERIVSICNNQTHGCSTWFSTLSRSRFMSCYGQTCEL